MAESEAETPSTPGEFESKYFEFHGVRLPPFCRGKMEEIANFPVRPSDVWIVTYPKSGTSLLQEVVYLVSQGADPDEIGLMNIDEQLPVLEYPQPGLDIIKELTSPRLIKSHLPYRFLPSDLHNGDSKVIYMARNPKDLVVAYYQFHRSLRTMSYRGTFQEFCRRFMNDKLGYGSWFEHVQEFWEHRLDANVLFLKYEDMHRDLVTMVEQLARFLGVSCDKAQLEALIEHCHQLVDQCCNAEALPVGRGTRRAAPAPLPLPRVPSLQVFVVPHFSAPLPRVSLLQGTWKLGRRWPSRVPSTAVCPVSSAWCFSLQEWLLGCFSFCGQDVFMQVPSQMAPQSRAAEGFGAVKFRSSQHADGFLSLQLARGRVDDAGGGGSPCEGAPFSRTPSGCWLHR
ncbi:sulfotransferase 4A1 isoform X1 [Pteropus alecto]|uniref:sulfotransferase 4A1 isoform X1 n=1 Tax=Pteropus alecto TaxID=9402 RepID=UPI0007686606|nr:sulfotransferase 4A1 isoform X1 [Pteropus alecto]XP_024906410.1 sulfotransferase 4A1 isoform X1 [Pteropus alecto]